MRLYSPGLAHALQKSGSKNRGVFKSLLKFTSAIPQEPEAAMLKPVDCPTPTPPPETRAFPRMSPLFLSAIGSRSFTGTLCWHCRPVFWVVPSRALSWAPALGRWPRPSRTPWPRAGACSSRALVWPVYCFHGHFDGPLTRVLAWFFFRNPHRHGFQKAGRRRGFVTPAVSRSRRRRCGYVTLAILVKRRHQLQSGRNVMQLRNPGRIIVPQKGR